LAVSYLTYQDQHHANSAAAVAHELAGLTRYANNVSYSPATRNSGQVKVTNLSNQTITNVMVEAQSVSREPGIPLGSPTLVGLGPLRACSMMTADVSNIARLYLVGYGVGPVSLFGGIPGATVPYPVVPSPSLTSAKRTVQHLVKFNGFHISVGFLIFTDAEGMQWARTNGRGFREAPQYFNPPTPWDTAPVRAPVRYVGTAPVHTKISNAPCS
jgi:hypothetical protein